MVLGRVSVWTGVDFSVCVVAPPGERSVGAADGATGNHTMGDALLLLRHGYADVMRVMGISTRRK